MPRFYFHIRDGERLIKDPEGSELSDLESARAEALVGARELLAAKLKAGEVIDGQRFEIVDEGGNLLTVVPLKDVVRLS